MNNISPVIKNAALRLKSLLNNVDLDGIRKFQKTYPGLCNEVYAQFYEKYKGNPPAPIKRAMEALKGLKEGYFAKTLKEQLGIMKNHVPSDQNLRQFDWYRKKMGGAWILWKLGSPWDKILPGGLLWVRSFVCPLPGGLLDSYYPVPDLSFSPWSTHKIVKCEQVVKEAGGNIGLMDGGLYAKLPEQVKINITKPPIDL